MEALNPLATRGLLASVHTQGPIIKEILPSQREESRKTLSQLWSLDNWLGKYPSSALTSGNTTRHLKVVSCYL